MELNFTVHDLITRLGFRFMDYAHAIEQHGKKRLLGQHLALNPKCIDAAFHHFGRIGKFLAEIPVEAAAGAMTPAELRAFRNFAQHGSEKIDASSLEAHDFLMRYTHVLIYELMPVLERAGFGVVGPLLLPLHRAVVPHV